MAPDLTRINWQSPWTAPFAVSGPTVARAWAGGVPLHHALGEAGDAPVRFVPQSDLPNGVAYESFIFQTRQCPTRDNLHDLFNGLCWHHFPRTKSKLNALQAAEIARDGVQPHRGAVRDALTVFDENAALLQATPELWQALEQRDWRRLLVDLRGEWRHARLVLFGHALLEKLVVPRKDITAHVYLVPTLGSTAGAAAPDAQYVAELDAWVAHDLSAEKLATKPFTPLPVLGVPGWWPPNESAGFYDDVQVFRPLRRV